MAVTNWPAGIASAGVAAGIKAEGLDLGVIVGEAPLTWAGVFTRNAAAAACVGWDRARLGAPVRVLVVNSGNANACTGAAGEAAVRETAQATAAALGCEPEEVLVASTGPIGVPLDAGKIAGSIPHALAALSGSAESFAQAIVTTDTYTKVAVSPGTPTFVGVAKGAAMVAPGMATMLAFVATDAAVTHAELQGALAPAVERSFNRICIDGCESTNDSVICLTTGTVACGPERLASGLQDVCNQLALAIARDAEGGTKLVRVQVTGASDESTAAGFGRAIASSSLWRAAVHGADPNWGRVLAALGAHDRSLDLASVEIAIGPETVFKFGEVVGSLEAARKAMDEDSFELSCVVGSGPGAAEVLTADLSPAYVTLNALGAT
ncbi:MAG: bifunctional glutamate N-acetyltransferase/amino-acid acetyltransferase ArgJ [Actinomycetota bacterium]|nr:bifunctional glutamate N-acetyltransferase/amino-acid acetyltransferase ArgJ [Actinomycetota bacterium]